MLGTGNVHCGKLDKRVDNRGPLRISEQPTRSVLAAVFTSDGGLNQDQTPCARGLGSCI